MSRHSESSEVFASTQSERIDSPAHAPLTPELPDHPADVRPVIRHAAVIAGDVVGLGVSAFGRAGRIALLPLEVDLAVLFSVLEGTPAIRRRIEKVVGTRVADVGLAVSNALASGFARSPLGPAVDIAHRSLQLSEALSRRRVWTAREQDLTEVVSDETAAPVVRPTRPTPIPPGPIEKYAERAWRTSLAGAGAGFLLRRSIERSAGVLAAGLPRAARLGREAFAAQVGRALAARGVVVLHPSALRRLDRIDCVVLESTLLLLSGAEDLIQAIERTELRFVVAHNPKDPVPVGFETLPGGDAFGESVRTLQRAGHTVCVVASGGCNGLPEADVGVGLRLEFDPVPWGASMIARDRLAEARFVVEACEIGRGVSRRSIQIAMGGVAAGSVFALTGALPGSTRRALSSVSAASALSMAEGARAGVALARRPEPLPSNDTNWHTLDTSQTLERLGTTRAGLSNEEAAKRRKRIPGLEPEEPQSVLKATLQELANPLTPMLAAGAGLSLAIGSVTDALIVSSVVGANALIGGVQRVRTERALAGLLRAAEVRARVQRNGIEVSVASSELVPGDIVELRAGDAVPADCRVLSSSALEVDESSLTGESLPVTKDSAPSQASAITERRSMLYEGTSVAAGTASAAVVATGLLTESARTRLLAVEEAPHGGVESRLKTLTMLTAPVSIAGGAGLVASGVLRGIPIGDVVSAGVGLTVAAVPEGLPLLSTVAQLGGARRLSERGVLVRNTRAIEALGRVDVVCFDKTGTLTQGNIALHSVSDGKQEVPIDNLTEDLKQVLATAVRATPADEDNDVPHLTDMALLEGAQRTGVGATRGARGWRAVAELPFEPERGFHAVLGEIEDGTLISVKGAPEVVLLKCSHYRDGGDRIEPMTIVERSRLGEALETMARHGDRVLALAERSTTQTTLSSDDIDDLTFVGFLGFTDPVRPSAAAAVEGLRKAGVEVIMITGDHPSTAEGIAAELGLLNGHRVITGPELDGLDDVALVEIVKKASVFARVTPSDKVQIVRALRRAGRVIAVTGDGANDAPAIRLADVGIALGEKSTPAARHAADFVVLDERIETIVDAVLEGRALWASVRESVAILVGGNLGEVAFMLGGSLVDGRAPLNARQLLLVNMLTDVAPSMAIALRRPRGIAPEQLLREGPDSSLGAPLNRAIALRAATTAGGAGAAWILARASGTRARASTVALVALVGTQLGQTLVAGHRDPIVLAAGLGSAAVLAGAIQTPGLSHFLGSRPLGPVGWGIAVTSAGGATAASVLLPGVARGARLLVRSDWSR
ncbi:MAG: cation-translocating P-type ATPase [Actinomycetota bacterium]